MRASEITLWRALTLSLVQTGPFCPRKTGALCRRSPGEALLLQFDFVHLLFRSSIVDHGVRPDRHSRILFFSIFPSSSPVHRLSGPQPTGLVNRFKILHPTSLIRRRCPRGSIVLVLCHPGIRRAIARCCGCCWAPRIDSRASRGPRMESKLRSQTGSHYFHSPNSRLV